MFLLHVLDKQNEILATKGHRRLEKFGNELHENEHFILRVTTAIKIKGRKVEEDDRVHTTECRGF